MAKPKKKNKAQVSQNIVDTGLSQKAKSILVSNLSIQTVQGAEGAAIDDIAGDEVTLALALIDESGSMSGATQEVIDEFALNLEAIKGSVQADQILMSLWSFSEQAKLIHGYLPLDLVEGLKDYHPGGGTSLYDCTLGSLVGIIAYEEELRKQGIRTKINLAVFSDGDDTASRKAKGTDVKTIMDELYARENVTLTFIGFVDTKFAKQMADAMGFRNYIAVGAADAKGRRRAFGTWSQSVISTSQNKFGSSSLIAP